MNIFALEIWYDEGNICTFYTVNTTIDNDTSYSETDKFFSKYADEQHKYYEQSLLLFRLITQSIANKYGATNIFFDRTENKAQALPPKPKLNVEEIASFGLGFPLRLYCYRISEQIVILFNGGIKDEASAQDSKDISMKFYDAQIYTKRIQRALQDKTIRISDNGRYLEDDNNNSQQILIY